MPGPGDELDPIFLTDARQQLRDRRAVGGDLKVGGDLGQRCEDEAAPAQTRMGQGQLGPLAGELAIDEQVDVERAGRVAWSGTSPGGQLESLGNRQEPVRWQQRLTDDRGIQVGRLG